MNNIERKQAIATVLQRRFSPLVLEINDDSSLHVGHQASGGAGHFSVKIVSEAFTGLSRLARHRMVYEALSHLMSREIHALKIDAQELML